MNLFWFELLLLLVAGCFGGTRDFEFYPMDEDCLFEDDAASRAPTPEPDLCDDDWVDVAILESASSVGASAACHRD